MSLMAMCLAKDGVHTKFGVKSHYQLDQRPDSDQLLTPALFDKITRLLANAGFACIMPLTSLRDMSSQV